MSDLIARVRSKPVIVAEMSNAHNGDLDRARRWIAAVHEAGADYVKFQCYTPRELVALRGDGPAPEPWGSDGWTMEKLYEKAQTPVSWFPALVGDCQALGIPWFASVFGEGSIELMEMLGCPIYKIASLDRRSVPLWDMVRATGKPMIVSTPNPLLHTAHDRLLTLYCPPGYPQDPEDMIFQDRFDGGDFDGFSYHGKDVFPLFDAIRSGAMLIETHVELDDEPSELETECCLTMSDLYELIEFNETMGI